MDINPQQILTNLKIEDTYEMKELGKEMYEHFGKGSGRKIFPLFSSPTFTHLAIKDAWRDYLKWSNEKGKNSFEYFMGCLIKKMKRG